MAPTLKLYALGGAGGPNPSKILILLNKLKLDYEVKALTFDDGENGVKGAKYLKINPNGRAPSLIDSSESPSITVWESGAILQYLAEKYDPSGSFLGKNLSEKAQINSWLFHQVSGLGPVQGQVVYMDKYFSQSYGEEPGEKTKKRFRDEVDRLYKVLDGQLERQKSSGSEWVVLDRMTIADISYYGWVTVAAFTGIDLSLYPHVEAWNKKMEQDEAVLAYRKRHPNSH